jgi:hypothetical protein
MIIKIERRVVKYPAFFAASARVIRSGGDYTFTRIREQENLDFFK